MIELSHKQKENIGLQYVLDLLEPASAYGRRLLKDLRPFAPGGEDALRAELDNIEKALQVRPALEQQFRKLERALMQVKDIKKSLERIGQGVLDEIDLFEIKRYLLLLAEIAPLFGEIDAAARFHDIVFKETDGALELLDPEKSRVPTFHISVRYSAELAAIRKEKKEVEQRLRVERDADTCAGLKQRRGELAAREQREEEAVRARLTEQLLPYQEALLYNTDTIARLDLTIQKAVLAAGRCTKPEIGGDAVVLQEMLNPHIASLLEKEGRAFTPVTLTMPLGTTVITGANMGGKSVALKTAGLNVALAHYGFYVFAKEMSTPLFDRMFLVSEDLEAVDRGLSSFGGEIVRLNEITEAVKEDFCFVLLDEFARGTNPDEGAAIAHAVAAYFNSRHAVTAMTTHYDGVSDAAAAHYQVMGLAHVDMAALRAEIEAASPAQRVGMIGQHMDYGLYRVEGKRQVSRDAINICHLLKCDKEIANLVEDYY